MPVRKAAALPRRSVKVTTGLLHRMAAMAGAVGSQLVRETGPVELLRRLSDPFWFQAFGCALGFDWHSPNITAIVCGALREATKRRSNDLGIVVCGGQGATSYRIVDQIQYACDRSGDPAESLAYASRMTAKVDSAAVQDGYDLDLHSFLFVPGASAWGVVQQGANGDVRHPRRYHWFSERMRSYVHDPHAAVACDKRVEVLNLVAGEGDRHRQALTALSRENPDRILRELRPLLLKKSAASRLNGRVHKAKVHAAHGHLPGRHMVKPRDLNPAVLRKVLQSTYERQATEFEQLLGEPSVGAATLRSLSQIAELLYNVPACRRDPAAYGFVHGNRDGFPFRLHRRAHEPSIEWLRDAVDKAKVGQPEKGKAFKALAAFAARL